MLDRVYRYKGSGTRWTNHLKVHGRNVTVGVLGLYTDKEHCFKEAMKFSKENNIVESDEWANLVDETGMMGVSLKGEKNPFYGKKHSPETIERIRQKNTGKSFNKGAYRSPEQRAKISASLKGRKNPEVAERLRGRKLPKETIAKMLETRKGYTHSMETRAKLSQKAKEQWARQKADEVKA